jgi:hypothetical protein
MLWKQQLPLLEAKEYLVDPTMGQNLPEHILATIVGYICFVVVIALYVLWKLTRLHTLTHKQI